MKTSPVKMRPTAEQCALCGCELHRTPAAYANATIRGRSGATKHHSVAQRFFRRSRTRPARQIEGIFASCPSGNEGESADVFCYECHELLLHNPVLLREDVSLFAELVRMRNLAEAVKLADYSKIALLDASRGTVVTLHNDMPDALISEMKLQALQDIPRTRIVRLKRPLREGTPVDPWSDLATISDP